LGKPWILKFSSIRNFFYEKLERRELFSPSVRVIVPVSNILGDLIKQKHPDCSSMIKPAIYPAVALQGSGSSRRREIPVDGGALGFIGKEWKRKGLPKAIRIWRELKKCRPNLKLKVAGVTKEMISHQLNSNDNGIEVVGFVKDKKSFYQSIDMLIHPAKLEAFGMVISEALCMHVPVICSSECGASEVLSKSSSFHIPEAEPDARWVQSTNEILGISKSQFPAPRKWDKVAEEYKLLYEGIL
jgi:UDP-glucose:(heptosyl)LPS alpha-1,3-glucosyltransferase